MGKRLLFICSQNKLRSPTAEVIFSQVDGLEVRSAGLNPDAENPLSSEDIEWADEIFVMEQMHKNKLNKKFRLYMKNRPLRVLGIPDDYEFMQPELISLLKSKMERYIRI